MHADRVEALFVHESGKKSRTGEAYVQLRKSNVPASEWQNLFLSSTNSAARAYALIALWELAPDSYNSLRKKVDSNSPVMFLEFGVLDSVPMNKFLNRIENNELSNVMRWKVNY